MTDPAKSEPIFVAAVSVKAANFNPNFVEGWLANLESQFAIAGITAEMTKFRHLIASLPPEQTSHFARVAYRAAYQQGDYAIAKQTLIRIHAVSFEQQMKSLLDDETLGDLTPSQAYRKMKNIVENCSEVIPDRLFMERWMKRLPPQIYSSVKLITNFDEATHLPLVDEIFEQFQATQFLHAAPIATNNRNSNHSNNNRNRQPRNNINRGRPSTPADLSELCWYHQLHGRSARKCTPPCSWRSGNSQQ